MLHGYYPKNLASWLQMLSSIPSGPLVLRQVQKVKDKVDGLRLPVQCKVGIHEPLGHVPSSVHVFAFETLNGAHVPMCQAWFWSRCNEVWASTSLASLTGHSFRTGGMTDFLLSGVDPFIVMVQGPWRSHAFLEYWHLCKEIIPTFIGVSLSSKSSLLSSMSTFKECLINPL